MNGKGSKPRPLSVPYEAFAVNWDEIFKKSQRKSVIVDVKEDANGDQFIEIPDDMLKAAGLKEGDNVSLKKCKDGSIHVKKEQ